MESLGHIPEETEVEEENCDGEVLLGLDEASAQRAIQLIRVEGEKIIFTSEGRSFLLGLKAPLCVISVVGQQKSGKSYFCNKVLLDLNSRGFAMSSAAAACTEGIWVWNQPKQLKLKNGIVNCIVLDTQGTGSTERDSTQDAKLLSLAVLLSSYLVYNTMGHLNEVVMNELSLVSQLSLHICDKAIPKNHKGGNEDSPSDSDISSVSKHFPVLLWVLRDFSLELVDEHHVPISPCQYLELALAPREDIAVHGPSASNEMAAKNRVKAAFRSMFRSRDCATMRRPVEDEAQLQQLENLPLAALRPGFVRDLEAVRERIWAAAAAKTMDGRFLDGPALALLLDRYSEALGSGDCISVSDSLSQARPRPHRLPPIQSQIMYSTYPFAIG